MQIIPKDSQERENMLLGSKIIGDFGATIAVPVVLFVLIAQWLEGKYGGAPYITIVAFVCAALLTVKIIIKRAKEYGKQYEAINNLNKEKTKPDIKD